MDDDDTPRRDAKNGVWRFRNIRLPVSCPQTCVALPTNTDTSWTGTDAHLGVAALLPSDCQYPARVERALHRRTRSSTSTAAELLTTAHPIGARCAIQAAADGIRDAHQEAGHHRLLIAKGWAK